MSRNNYKIVQKLVEIDNFSTILRSFLGFSNKAANILQKDVLHS